MTPRLTPKRENEIRDILANVPSEHAYAKAQVELLAEIDALREELNAARKFYGPAGLRAVSSYLEERDRLAERINKLRGFLDSIRQNGARHSAEIANEALAADNDREGK